MNNFKRPVKPAEKPLPVIFSSRTGRNKAIDELDIRTARKIFKHIMHGNLFSWTDADVKKKVRTYLRDSRVHPQDAIEWVEKNVFPFAEKYSG